MTDRLASIRNWPLASRQGLLLAVMSLALLVVGPLGYGQYGPAGLVAAVLAATVCLASAGLALWACESCRRPEQVLQAMILGLALRTGIPLGFALAAEAAGLLAWAGLVYQLLACYAVALGSELVLSLPGGPAQVVSRPRELT